MTYNDPQQAFEEAIKNKRLSDDPQSPIYAGNYMYMGSNEGKDLFKNIDSRNYLD